MTATDSRLPLPFFVYGSLLPGLSNHRLLSQYNPTLREARFSGGQLFPCSPRRMPYPALVVDGNPENEVVGMVAYIPEVDFLQALTDLDYLEGFFSAGDPNNLYDRIIGTVQTEDGEEEVYLYVASKELQALMLGFPVVPDGDWKTWISSTARKAAKFW